MDFEERRARRILARQSAEKDTERDDDPAGAEHDSQQHSAPDADQNNRGSADPEGWDVPGVDRTRPAPGNSETRLDTGDAALDRALDTITGSTTTIRTTATDPGDSGVLTDDATVTLLAAVATARRRLDAAYLSAIALVDKRAAAKTTDIGTNTTHGLVKSLAGTTPGRAKADVNAARAIHGHAVSTATSLTGDTTGDTTEETTGRAAGPLAAMGDLLAAGTISLAHIDTAVRALDHVPDRLLNATIAPSNNTSDADRDASAEDADSNDTNGDDDDASECDENAGSSDSETDAGSAGTGRSVRAEICDYFARTAPSTSPGNLRQLGKHLIDVLEPDTDDHFDPESYSRRSMTMSTDITGMVFGTYQLDPAAGAALKAILDPLAAPRPAQTSDDSDNTGSNGNRDDAGSTGAGPFGPGPDFDDPARARQQADALFGLHQLPENAETPASNGVGPSRAAKLRPGRRPAHVTVVTTADKITGGDPTPSHCDQTGDTNTGTLARLVCDATFERLILDARGAVLDQGMPVRLATPAQKRAISARDKGCVFPGCDRPPSWCDVHHVQWHSRGGPTDVANMCLLCEHHHTLIHTGTWQMRMIHDIPYTAPTEPALRLAAPTGSMPAIPDTTGKDGWVRNSYFDQLKDTEHLAKIIIHASKTPTD